MYKINLQNVPLPHTNLEFSHTLANFSGFFINKPVETNLLGNKITLAVFPVMSYVNAVWRVFPVHKKVVNSLFYNIKTFQ